MLSKILNNSYDGRRQLHNMNINMTLTLFFVSEIRARFGGVTLVTHDK